MPYRLVIFDFDGTLADSVPWTRQVFNVLARRHGFREVSAEELEGLRGRSNREIVAELGVPWWKLPWIARDMRRLSADAAGEIPTFSGVAELLTRLEAAGIAAAIVTSNGEVTVRRVLGPQIAARVGHYHCGVSLFGKAGKLKELLRQLRLRPAEAIYVGDETRDIEAARAAGLDIAAVEWGYATAAVLRAHRPTFSVGSFGELLEIVERGPRTGPQNG